MPKNLKKYTEQHFAKGLKASPKYFGLIGLFLNVHPEISTVKTFNYKLEEDFILKMTFLRNYAGYQINKLM